MKHIVMTILAALSLVAFTGCEAERDEGLGRDIERGAEDVGEGAEDVGEDIGDSAEDVTD